MPRQRKPTKASSLYEQEEAAERWWEGVAEQFEPVGGFTGLRRRTFPSADEADLPDPDENWGRDAPLDRILK